MTTRDNGIQWAVVLGFTAAVGWIVLSTIAFYLVSLRAECELALPQPQNQSCVIQYVPREGR